MRLCAPSTRQSRDTLCQTDGPARAWLPACAKPVGWPWLPVSANMQRLCAGGVGKTRRRQRQLSGSAPYLPLPPLGRVGHRQCAGLTLARLCKADADSAYRLFQPLFIGTVEPAVVCQHPPPIRTFTLHIDEAFGVRHRQINGSAQVGAFAILDTRRVANQIWGGAMPRARPNFH